MVASSADFDGRAAGLLGRVRQPAALAVLAVLAVLAPAGCDMSGAPRAVTLSGPTMGTGYRVTLVDAPEGLDEAALHQAIGEALTDVNDQMSTYLPDSVLSRFNAHANDDWFDVPAELLQVIVAARRVSERSDGAFDVTVGPVVNLWGFGPDGVERLIPDAAAVAAARERVGYRHLRTREAPPALAKGRADVYVDLSAIAKGYAVDRVAALLDAWQIANYLVEIGGELRTRGHNARDADWTIAIERPVSGQRDVQSLIRVAGLSVATSGDYRNFFEVDGRRYSHTIDPRTGRPVTHALASVTVLHESAMQADALATALSVLGPRSGRELAMREGLTALFIIHEGDGLTEMATGGFDELVVTD